MRDYSRSELTTAIDEWILNERDRAILKRRLIDGMQSRRYSNDGYYYDDGGMSNRRGRAANGRFVSRDGSEMARKLREMMEDAPDANTKNEIQRLADRIEQM